jgi:hypothetical protein
VLLVLLLATGDPVSVGPGVAQELAALGVTSVTVLRDEHTTAVALEGWAFDADRSAEAATRVVAANPNAARVLRPVVESALHVTSSPRSRRGPHDELRVEGPGSVTATKKARP